MRSKITLAILVVSVGLLVGLKPTAASRSHYRSALCVAVGHVIHAPAATLEEPVSILPRSGP
jgi:hypothetical protein